MNGRATRRSVAGPLTVALLLSAVAMGLHVATLGRLKQLQPSYPSRIVLTVATPPTPFVYAHILFPSALVVGGCGVLAAALNRTRARQPREALNGGLFAVHAIVMSAFVIVFAWALFWSTKVLRLSERAG
jgi:hypothetical protein